MKLLAKFNLILGLVFAFGLAIAGAVSNRFLQAQAREQVLQQARLMNAAMQSVRTYTSVQVGPLLAMQQEHQHSFLAQTVPAFAATENFNYLRKAYPDYAYKEATLNPTNPRDRAVDWEADIINDFRNHPAEKELVGERDTPTGRSLYIASPIVAAAPCLQCHSTPAAAPIGQILHYGANNGFGWNLDETVGAHIISVPMAVPQAMAAQSFRALLVDMAAIFLASLVVLDLALLFTVVRPLRSLSKMADEISVGKTDMPELPVKGKDEISVLAGSFNRMRRSLERAIKMLDAE